MKQPLTNTPYVPYREPPTCPELSLDPPTEPNLKLPVEPEPERKHRRRPPTPHRRRRAARDGSNRHRSKATVGQYLTRIVVVVAIALMGATPVYLWLSAATPPAPVVPAVAPIGPVTAPLTVEPTSKYRVPRTTVSRAPKRLIVPTATLTRKKIVPRTTTEEE